MNDNSENRLLLRRVHIDNYKCMSNFTFSPFGDITLLLGKNGCGKSAVFEAADNLHRFVCREGKVADLFPASSLTSWNKNGKQSFELEAGDNRRRHPPPEVGRPLIRHSSRALFIIIISGARDSFMQKAPLRCPN